ncbi:MAG: sigma 54-interacting transcriptional regulator [Desulfobacteraceae bacterium]|nr:sigma 54-interacting transcriptional regulator [Desulfobacteraceae bacterium]
MDIGEHWKTIFNTLHDGLIVVDISGRIVAVNPAAEQITGYAADEIEGRTCRILNCTGCKFVGKGAGENWCRMFAAGTVRDKKCLITKKDRRTVHILKSARVLRDEAGEMIGAVETLTDISQIIRQQREIQSLRQTYQLDEGFHGILGKSPVMTNLFEMIDNVARSDAPVMISGESGTGKEMVARAVHDAGPRKDKPFIKVNCAALNENLLESELFGHVKGAFTGADRSRLGRFEAAHEGTILLDEIGDIPLSTQVKLLRVIEEKKIERVGEHDQIPVDVRIITATNKNLEQLVQAGGFREDLYFRINVFPIHCPRLADRSEDIPMLVRHFIQRNTVNSEKKILGVTPEALDLLTSYAWPGNIRELRNTIEYAFVLCPGGSIDVDHLPPRVAAGQSEGFAEGEGADDTANGTADRALLERTLRQTGWNQSETARILGVSRVTVWKKIKKYDIARPWAEQGGAGL